MSARLSFRIGRDGYSTVVRPYPIPPRRALTIINILLVSALLSFLSPFTHAQSEGSSDLTVAQDSFDSIRESSTPLLKYNPRFAPDEILVKFKISATEKSKVKFHKQHGMSRIRTSKRGNFERLRVASQKTLDDLLQICKNSDQVEYAEKNYYVHAYFTPNDTYYSYQWNLYNSVNGGIYMNDAWNIQTGSSSVIIAVIDTGVAYEKYKNFIAAPDLASTNFVAGYNFVADTTHPNDDHGHGTHVTGTIAQSTNNSLGAAGVAFDCSIMPIKALDSAGSGNYADLAEAIYFAADNGAKVINMSLGGSDDSVILENAVIYAYNKGVTIVCAAGNEYQNGNAASYPAAYKPYCIAVGATRYDHAHCYYSNTGTYLDIAAPGGDNTGDQDGDGYYDGILQQTFSADPTSFAYYFFIGTSMATPHVSGVAALLISNGVSGPVNVRQALQHSSYDLGTPGWDEVFGWGLLDACAALTYIPGDLTADNQVNDADLQSFLANWLHADAFRSPQNLNDDNVINLRDFAVIASHWGE